jgi:anthranilate synthase component 1
MTQQEFDNIASQGYHKIPVSRKILADLYTPLSVYMRLANKPYSYFFESVQGGEKWGRYSIIGLPSKTIIKISGHNITIHTDGKVVDSITDNNPLDWIENYQKKFRVYVDESLPLFLGGLVGYFGYETIRYIEPRLAQTHLPDLLQTPDILLMVSEDVMVFDNLHCQLYLITHADADEIDALAKAEKKLDYLQKQLEEKWQDKNTLRAESNKKLKEEDFTSSISFQDYEKAVERVKQYILDGEVMQVVYSRRLSIPYLQDPLTLYRTLRCLNPSPYLYYLHCDDFHIVGSSPEILVRLENDVVTLRPIAGTRPRGKSLEEDKLLEKDLLSDQKELAEHLMLIDLGRNDIGRIAETGSVQVTEKMTIERYSHVMHIVSNVIGKLKPGLSAMDVLRATFPAGTVSGAPKIRAMEIINELETIKRGVYAGAIGYIGWNGNLDTAIAIRTAVIKDGILSIQAGGGLVADSIAQNEWDETQNKARAILRAAMRG